MRAISGAFHLTLCLIIINGNGLFVSDSCVVMDSKESSEGGEKEKLEEDMDTESKPTESYVTDNNAGTSDEGKEEDSVKETDVHKEYSEDKIDADELEVQELVSTQDVVMEEETVDMKAKDEADRLESSESKEETPQHSEEVRGTREPREKVSETPEKAKEPVTDENHLSESMTQNEHSPEIIRIGLTNSRSN